ncbi:precursor of major head subunit [Synechococcus phage S-PM2]|uniref:Precursor of major head subunit n=1 Tax=Synechococcus phage S-PM2 TaxID=238854 RepID=Q5GQN0_BPSYP|nr:major head protein [Synechococcus phage S-PM2]CAF34172.1 precursor of major head subunit [Synechococcus phage S-PM2]CFW42269.1 precursor of major head subunit [Synechococcus phage S-PM2]
MFNAEHLQEKWSPVLNHGEAPAIGDRYKRAVTSVLLENQERFLREERGMLNEVAVNSLGAGTIAPAGSALGSANTGGLAGFDPVLISLVRRAMPNLMAYDVCGVQPMSGPTGLIFAMRSRYENQAGEEALFNEPDTGFTGGYDASQGDYAVRTGAGVGGDSEGNNPALLNDAAPGTYEVGSKMPREDLERMGEANRLFREMSFSIEKTSVTAQSRALKAEYTLELAQDLKAIHGLDAEQELANILSSEVLAEINREVVRRVYTVAKKGAQNNVANAGIFDLDVDSNGRWSVEKFKGLLFQVERDANAIAQETRRGKGNFLICSADVASALAMAGVLDYSSGLNGAGGPSIGEVDDTGNLAVGTINGRIKVFVDPYAANLSDKHYYVIGYKGTSPYDAGLFYCPYVPLQMVRSIDPNTFQPKIGFKTRYGMVSNPFVTTNGLYNGTPDGEALTPNANMYYRRVQVTNLM